MSAEPSLRDAGLSGCSASVPRLKCVSAKVPVWIWERASRFASGFWLRRCLSCLSGVWL